jgi:hypothetical protein
VAEKSGIRLQNEFTGWQNSSSTPQNLLLSSVLWLKPETRTIDEGGIRVLICCLKARSKNDTPLYDKLLLYEVDR